MGLKLLLFLCFVVGCFAKDCPSKRIHTKLICYYSKLTNVDPCLCTHVVVPANTDFKLIEDLKQKLRGTKILLTVNEFNQDLLKTVKKKTIDGLEINLKKLDSKNDITEFINTVRSRLGNDLYLAIAVPAKAELLAKYYDMKAISKLADLLILQTAFLGSSKNVTFHPSRLSGLWDMQNTDSVVDLVTGLGAPLSKLTITLPIQAFKFTLQDNSLTTPGSPALELKSLTRSELCAKMTSGEDWTLERDQDQAGPYIFRGSEWISFEDPTSIDIKAKYARVRGLSGLALKDLSQDDDSVKCGGSLLSAAYSGLSKQTRAPRGAVLRSLEREILETPSRPLDTVHVSPYRISRVIDVEGHVHTIRKDTRTEFQCSRQGYFVHPHSCGRFYRCVKFDQHVDEFSVFEFDCPAGLAFDERVEVCVWPGSLSDGAPCSGSSEIAPVPRERFVCPTQPGYYADPENCRWFFACLDHGKSGITPYEFRCPFGLVFDEHRLICEWPWLVPTCKSGDLYGLGIDSVTFFGGGAGSGLVQKTNAVAIGHILQSYDGLGELGSIALGGFNGDLNLLKSGQAFEQNSGLLQSGKGYLANNRLYTDGRSGYIGENGAGLKQGGFAYSNVQQYGSQGQVQPGVVVFGTENNGNEQFLSGSLLKQNAYSNIQTGANEGGILAGSFGLIDEGKGTEQGDNIVISHVQNNGAGFGEKLSLGTGVVEDGNLGNSNFQQQLNQLKVDIGQVLSDGKLTNAADGQAILGVQYHGNNRYPDRGSIKYSYNSQQNADQVNLGLIGTGLQVGGILKESGNAAVVDHGSANIGGATIVGTAFPQTILIQDGNVDQISTVSQGYTTNLGSAEGHLNSGGQVTLLDSNLNLNKEADYGRQVPGGATSYTNINQGYTGGQVGIIDNGNYAKNSENKILTATVQLSKPSGFTVTHHGNNYANTDDKATLVNEGINVQTYPTNPSIVYETNDQLDVINGNLNLATATLNSNFGGIYNKQHNVLVNSSVKTDLSSVQYTDNSEKYISNPALIPVVNTGPTSSVQFHKTVHNYDNSNQRPILLDSHPKLVENKLFTLNNGYQQGAAYIQQNTGSILQEAKVINEQLLSPITSTVNIHGQTDSDTINYNNQYANDAKFVRPIISQTFTTHGQSVGDTDRYNGDTVVLNTPKLKYNIQQPTSVTYTTNLAHDGSVTDTRGSLHTISGESADNFSTKSTALNYARNNFAVTPKNDIFKLAIDKFATPAAENKQFTYATHEYQTPVQIQENVQQLPVANFNTGTAKSHAQYYGISHGIPSQQKLAIQEPVAVTHFYGTKTQVVPIVQNQPVAITVTPKYDEKVQEISTIQHQLPIQTISVTPKSEQIVTIQHQPQFVETVTAGPAYNTQFYGKNIQQSTIQYQQAPIETVSVTPKSEQIVTIQHQPQFVETVTSAPKYDTQFYGKQIQQFSTVEHQVPIQTVSVVPKSEQVVAIQHQPQFVETVTAAPQFDTQFYVKQRQQTSDIEHQPVSIQTVSVTPKSEQILTIQHQPQFFETVTAAPKYDTQFYGKRVQQTSTIEHQQVPIQTISVTQKPEQILTIQHQPQFVETVTAAPKYDTQFYGKRVQQTSTIEHQQIPIQTISVTQRPEQILTIQHQPQFAQTVTSAPKYDTQFFGKQVQPISTIEHQQVPIQTISVTPKPEQILNIHHQPQFVQTVTAPPKYDIQFYGKQVQQTSTIEHQQIPQTISVRPKSKQIVTIQHQPQFVETVTVAPNYETQFYNQEADQNLHIQTQPISIQTVSVRPKYQPQDVKISTVHQQSFVAPNLETVSIAPEYQQGQFVTNTAKTYEIQQPIVQKVIETVKPIVQIYDNYSPISQAKISSGSVLGHNVPVETVTAGPVQTIYSEPAKIKTFYSQKVEQNLPIQTVTATPTIVESYSYVPPQRAQVNIKYESREYLPPKLKTNTVYVPPTRRVQLTTQKIPEVFVSTTPKYAVFQEYVQPKQTFEGKVKVQPTIISQYKYENPAYANYQTNLNLDSAQEFYELGKIIQETPLISNINYGNKMNLQSTQELYAPHELFVDVPKINSELNRYSSKKPFTASVPIEPVNNYQTEYILSTPKPTFVSTIAPIIQQTPKTRTKVIAISKSNLLNDDNVTPTFGYISTANPILTEDKSTPSGSFYYYDSRYNTGRTDTAPTSGQYFSETSDFIPELSEKTINYEPERLVTTPKPLFIPTVIPTRRKLVTTSVPLDTYQTYDDNYGTDYVVTTYKPKLATIIQPEYQNIVSTTSGVPIDTYSSEDISSTIKPSTFRGRLKQKIVTTTLAPEETYDNENYDFGYTLTTTKPIITTVRPIVKKKKIITTTLAPKEVYANYDYEEYLVSSQKPFETVKLITPKPKGKTIVRVNDFHPFLTTKLGAQCTCVSNTLKLRTSKAKAQDVIDYEYNLSDNVPVTKITSSGPASYDDYNEPGVYVVGNTDSYDYDYEPQKITTVTQVPQVRIKSTTNAIRPAPTPIYVARKRITSVSPIEIASVTSVPETGISSTAKYVSRKKSKEEKIAEAVNEGLSLVKSAIKGYVDEAIETHKFDRYGPGGWRSRDETLQGTVDCQRAGLFRHPTQCNKFYACHWDCTKQRYTLHVFNCPVHLIFDMTMGACNWPSKGPACTDNTLLPNV